MPIVHVNADDVDACIAAVHLAIDFRRRFGHDVIIDLIGYRRFGHNETDEPAYTQPDMYERIKTHPTVRELYAQKLIAQGIVDGRGRERARRRGDRAPQCRAPARQERYVARPRRSARDQRLRRRSRRSRRRSRARSCSPGTTSSCACPTASPSIPNSCANSSAARRRFANDGEVDWGLGEALAFASLVEEGTPIRLTGQDTQRGTFSHRHLVFHDAKTNATYAPIQHLGDARASFEIYNSPLSEYACLGFEYGYAVETPNALVLWEAQFGDFNNGAQIIIDQFIAAGQAKWGETSRLVLLLPHGYEGAGPEHSSARIERFLQLSAEGNVQVANCSTAAQYFHLLRLQARQPRALPLVIFTPKSLLRMKAASGHARRSCGRNVPAGARRSALRRSSRRGRARAALLGQDLLRSHRAPGLREGGKDGDRARRVALAVADGRDRRYARGLSESHAGRMGAGRAEEHGRARARAPATGRTAAQSASWTSITSAARTVRARRKATVARTRSNKNASFARRSRKRSHTYPRSASMARFGASGNASERVRSHREHVASTSVP